MNLASRHTGSTNATTGGSGVSGTTATFPVNAQVVPPVSHGIANPSNHTGRGNSALLSLFNSGLTFPREMIVQARGAQDNVHMPIQLNFTGTIGQGTFGQIERATLTIPAQPTECEQNNDSKSGNADHGALQVAVKRVLQDPRYKNRELSIMQRLNNHPNVVKFYYYYYSTASSSRSHRSSSTRTGSNSSSVDVFLHLVLECFPESLCELIYRYLQRCVKLPTYAVKVYTYQMLKALAYLHSHQICHRDIKSSNLLVNESTLVLKICDLGSAKEMVPGTANVSYISSRYYRAPELLFGAQYYTCAIDTWSGGCVLAEMLLQHCLFMGADSVDQLVKVIRILGTPTQQDILSMNSVYRTYSFPDVRSCPVKLFFPQHTPTDLLALMSKMLVYNPAKRITPSNALSDPCFDELRALHPNGRLPNGAPMPPHIFSPDRVAPTVPALGDDEAGHISDPSAGWAANATTTDSRHWSNKKAVDVITSSKKNVKSVDEGSRKGRSVVTGSPGKSSSDATTTTSRNSQPPQMDGSVGSGGARHVGNAPVLDGSASDLTGRNKVDTPSCTNSKLVNNGTSTTMAFSEEPVVADKLASIDSSVPDHANSVPHDAGVVATNLSS